MSQAPATGEKTWVDVQKKVFTRWSNNFLKERKLKIDDMFKDLKDGIILIQLLEILSAKSLGKYNKAPKLKPQNLENIGLALNFIHAQGIKLVAIGPEDIYDGNTKLILGLIWTLILRFQIQRGGPDGNAKAELLEWVRKQVAPYGLQPKNFNFDWCDGRVLYALTDSLRPGVLDYEGRTKDANQDIEKAMETAKNEYDIPRLMDVEDMVELPDELAVMTYVSCFRDWWLEDQKRRAAEIEAERQRKMKTADPSQCYAHGPGLTAGTTNNEAPFTIQSVNYFGDPLPFGGNEFIVDIAGPESVKCNVQDKGDGTYPSSYVPRKVGDYKIAITLRGEPIKGSPYGPAKITGPSAANSTASGPGVEGARVGQAAPFKIRSVDANGRPVPTGNDPFTANVTGPDGPIAVSLKDNKDGTYDGSYTPKTPGFYTVEVKLNGENIKNSPFHPLMESANAGKSWAEGPGLVGGKTGRHNPITIHAVDADGKPLNKGGDPFKVKVSGPETHNPAVKDNGDGTYSVDYVVATPGNYTVDITLHDQPIKDSPFHPLIKPDVDPQYCYADGPGLKNTVDNEPAHFTIYARDGDDKPKTEGGDPFVVKIDGPEPTPANVVDNGDGTYSVTYHPNVPGKYKINVTLEGTHIKNSPYTADCKAGTDAGNSGFTNFSFVVQTRDKRGQNKNFGGDKFDVSISGPSQIKVNTKDNGDGTYSASYNLDKKGSYSIKVTLNGNQISGSPFTQAF